MKKVTAIFDIGKTNKKFVLYDQNYNEVYAIKKQFPEDVDEDGFPCEDLPKLLNWIKSTLKSVLKKKKYKVTAVNFSTYGASFVYIDKNGRLLTPLYNYLKPYPKKLLKKFHNKYGSEMKIAKETGSPSSCMLNSGMQLYWLKKTQPKIYKKVKYALHFPQYLSYFLTRTPISEYTSIGCHTSLWNFKENKYHRWVTSENITNILPPIVPTEISIKTKVYGESLKVGVGIHDSSAALLPYLLSSQRAFGLISTGTWSVSLNPFSNQYLSKKDIAADRLNYMTVDGNPVRAVRLFLGKEYEIQTDRLLKYYKKEKASDTKVKFSKAIFKKQKNNKNRYKLEVIKTKRQQPKKTKLKNFNNFEEAYHQLIKELVDLQVKAIQSAMGDVKYTEIFIDGGFVNNKVFLKMLAKNLKPVKLYTTKKPIGSALGAALIMNAGNIKSTFIKKQFGLKSY